MAYCGKCGTKVDEGEKRCSSCGNPMEASTPQQQTQTQQQTADDQNGLKTKLAELNNTADTTDELEKTDIAQNKVMGIFAYISWLVLIPIFAAPKSKFARFHANQGLVLAITEAAWWILSAVLNTIMYAISWRLGSVVGTLLGIVNLVFIPLVVIGIVNAANGRAKELPVIGGFRILK